MTFSSFIGAFKWDYGRYDAFETIMEVRLWKQTITSRQCKWHAACYRYT